MFVRTLIFRVKYWLKEFFVFRGNHGKKTAYYIQEMTDRWLEYGLTKSEADYVVADAVRWTVAQPELPTAQEMTDRAFEVAKVLLSQRHIKA